MIAADFEVTLDAATHEYRRPDGTRVPGVTEVLSAVKVTADFQDIRSFSSRRAAVIDAKRDLGHALHSDAHALDDNDLVWSTVHPDVLPYLEAWATCRELAGLKPVSRERLVFHPVYGFAGTLDGIFEVEIGPYAGATVLGDLKTGDPSDAAAHLQTAAYEAAYLAMHPNQRIDMRWSIQLCPGRKIPYRIVPYSGVPERPQANRDFAKFVACLTVYWEQPQRRAKQ